MHDAFLCISLLSLHDYEVKMPDLTFNGGSKQARTKFSFSLWTWVFFLGTQLQESSPACDKVNRNNRDKYWKNPKSLFKRPLFSLRPSPSSFLNLPTMSSSPEYTKAFVEKYRGRWNFRTEFARFKWIVNPVFHKIATAFSDLYDSSKV